MLTPPPPHTLVKEVISDADSAAVCDSPHVQEAVFVSRPVGTTRGDGIKENMSDKHK